MENPRRCKYYISEWFQLEDGTVSIARATGTLAFPARFMFVAAMNPCPCSYYGDPVRECTCSLQTISRYQ